MKTSIKIHDFTLKSILIIMSYAALLILGLIYFQTLLNCLGTLLSIIQPFIIGFVLAFIFNIPMKYFYKKITMKNEKRKKALCAVLAIFLVILVVFLLIMVVVPQVVDNVRVLIENLPGIFSQAEQWVNEFLKDIRLSEDMLVKINEIQTQLAQTILSALSSWVPSIATGVSHITTSIINIFMGFVMAVYMLFSKDKLIGQLKRLAQAFLNNKHYQSIQDVVRLTGVTFENFLAGQLTEAVIIGVLCYIGCIILDIPYASIAAVVIGFTNIIPYFGPIIGAAISSVLIVFVSPIKAVIFLVFSTLLQQFESNLIYPHVVGSSVGLSALWVLFAVSVGGGLFGIPGMVFGLPTFSVIYELLRRWVRCRLKEKQLLTVHQKSEDTSADVEA